MNVDFGLNRSIRATTRSFLYHDHLIVGNFKPHISPKAAIGKYR